MNAPKETLVALNQYSSNDLLDTVVNGDLNDFCVVLSAISLTLVH